MFSSFHAMEQSLRTYLTESQSDSYNSRNASMYKYNNLKIHMDHKKISTPHIIIRVGISEIIYDIKSWEKLSGGIGTDERYIKLWIERNKENLNLQTLWREAKEEKKIQPIAMRDNDTDFSQE